MFFMIATNKTRCGLWLACLLFLPCSESIAQSPTPGWKNDGVSNRLPVRWTADSLATVRAFVASAPALLDSLAALHFARIRIRSLEKQLLRTKAERNGMAGTFTEAHKDATVTSFQLLDAIADRDRYRKKYRAANLERWGFRIGLGTYLGYQIKLLRP
ncbi:hypothetical protein [Fibrella aquatica]|uniref:hypothetical protein n=1 Tax=Fibrella aquatica TaxID=3242487 RepID=UPI003520A9CF